MLQFQLLSLPTLGKLSDFSALSNARKSSIHWISSSKSCRNPCCYKVVPQDHKYNDDAFSLSEPSTCISF